MQTLEINKLAKSESIPLVGLKYQDGVRTIMPIPNSRYVL
jgi:hypothetical protein